MTERFTVGIHHANQDFIDSLREEFTKKDIEADLIIGKGTIKTGFDALIVEDMEGEVDFPEDTVNIVIGNPETEKERSELATYYLEEGADNYFTVKENPRVIAAFTKNAMARVEKGMKEPESSVFEDIEVNENARVVTINGEVVRFSRKEFDLLSMFVRGPEIVFNREQLLKKIWGLDYPELTRTVDVHVSNLRLKLREAQSKADVRSVRRFGYRLISIEREKEKYGQKKLPRGADFD